MGNLMTREEEEARPEATSASSTTTKKKRSASAMIGQQQHQAAAATEGDKNDNGAIIVGDHNNKKRKTPVNAFDIMLKNAANNKKKKPQEREELVLVEQQPEEDDDVLMMKKKADAFDVMMKNARFKGDWNVPAVPESEYRRRADEQVIRQLLWPIHYGDNEQREEGVVEGGVIEQHREELKKDCIRNLMGEHNDKVWKGIEQIEYDNLLRKPWLWKAGFGDDLSISDIWKPSDFVDISTTHVIKVPLELRENDDDKDKHWTSFLASYGQDSSDDEEEGDDGAHCNPLPEKILMLKPPRSVPYPYAFLTTIRVHPSQLRTEQVVGFELEYSDGVQVRLGRSVDEDRRSHLNKKNVFHLQRRECIVSMAETIVTNKRPNDLRNRDADETMAYTWKVTFVTNTGRTFTSTPWKPMPRSRRHDEYVASFENKTCHLITKEGKGDAMALRSFGWDSDRCRICNVECTSVTDLPTTRVSRSLTPLQKLAERTLVNHYQDEAESSLESGVSYLENLRNSSGRQAKSSCSYYQNKLQQSDEAEMLRVSEKMYRYAKRKFEDKIIELKSEADKKLRKVEKKYTSRRDQYVSEWQKKQDSIYARHVDALMPHFDYIDSGGTSKLDIPTLCTSVFCREFYIPTELPSTRRCAVVDCVFMTQNCGCALLPCPDKDTGALYCPSHIRTCCHCSKRACPSCVKPCSHCSVLLCSSCNGGWCNHCHLRRNT